MKALIIRNIKLYFKDKGNFYTSLITPLILILLYSTFLKNVYVDSFNSALDQVGIDISDKYINGFVYGWLFSSLIAVSSVTISFCTNLLIVQDKVTKSINDINIAPIKKSKIALAYYFASVINTMIVVFIEIIVGFIIMAFSGWFLSIWDIMGIILSAFLLVNFGTALSSLIHFFLKTQGQMSAVGTLISTIYGFICGAYMPISQFGDLFQKILSFFPGTYGTSFIRYFYTNGNFAALINECNFPKEVVTNISKNFDVDLFFFGNKVPLGISFLVVFLFILLTLGIYIILNYQKNRKHNKN